jgi:hypothetical protein
MNVIRLYHTSFVKRQKERCHPDALEGVRKGLPMLDKHVNLRHGVLIN